MMAKKKNNRKNNGIKTVRLDENEIAKYPNRYIGTFEEMVKQDGNTIDAMIGAVSLINSELLATIAMKEPKDIDEETKEKVIEAYQYTMDRMLTSEENEEKILENWFGNYPLLFRMGMTFEQERLVKSNETRYNALSKSKQFKFNQIFDYIWNIRAYRNIVVNEYEVELPKTIYREELDAYKDSVKCLLLDFFDNGKKVLVFTHGIKGGKTKAAALINDHGTISNVPVDQLKLSYSFDVETGATIDPPKNYVFGEFELKF